MKLRTLLNLLPGLFFLYPCNDASVKNTLDTSASNMVPAHYRTAEIIDNPEKMEWSEEAKLGIFIHWGIYAVDGTSESWAFFNRDVTYDEYMSQANGFTASKYDPYAWAKLFK